MPEVIVLYKTTREPLREKGEKELQWYDGVRGEMLSFFGGRLGFEYREDEYLVAMSQEDRVKKGISSTYRMLPKVVDVEIVNYNKMKTTTNEKVVKKWFDDYVNYNITEAYVSGWSDNGITVVVSDEELDDFFYQAHRHGIRIITQ
jgi:hypothetical protein